MSHGDGKVSEKETSLASVLARMLRAPEAWTVLADRYLAALDEIAHADAARSASRRSWDHHDPAWARRERAGDLAEWHDLLLDRLDGSEAGDRLDRLASHPALGGAELTFIQAKLAHRRGDTDAARKLIRDCLEDLPGHEEFAGFATEIAAELPPRAGRPLMTGHCRRRLCRPGPMPDRAGHSRRGVSGIMHPDQRFVGTILPMQVHWQWRVNE